MSTAFQINAFQNNAFQISSSDIFQKGTKGKKYNHLLWDVDNNFEEDRRNDALAILLMIN